MSIFKHRFAVRFADVDHAKIVYYPVFFDYFHIAFEEFFREKMGSRGYLALLDTEHIGFPAVHAECDYRSPLQFGDTAETSLSLVRLGTKSITLAYQVHQVDGESPRLAAEGKVICVVTDLRSFESLEIPESIAKLFLDS